MIAIIDYGLGNVLAFQNVYKRLGIPAVVARTADDLQTADKLILPGVGAFDQAMKLFDGSGLRAPVEEMVIKGQTPVLGVCVGMQLLAQSSEEGELRGLNWVGGCVRKIDVSMIDRGPRLPHMGWNDVEPVSANPLFQQLERARFYFLHSYYFDTASADSVLATALYGTRFPCAVSAGHVYGVQFHPEKSHHYGVQLLRNFAELS